MSKQKQIRRTRVQWRALFAAHKQSGLSSTEFCRARGVNPKYFSLQRRQLGLPVLAKQRRGRSVSAEPVAADFVRVIAPTTSTPVLTVSSAGMTLTVSPAVSRDRVLALIDAMRSS